MLQAVCEGLRIIVNKIDKVSDLMGTGQGVGPRPSYSISNVLTHRKGIEGNNHGEETESKWGEEVH